MKTQIRKRLGLPHIRNVLAQFCEGSMNRDQACSSLGISTTRLYELRSEFLLARAQGRMETWQPGVSGGDHAPSWSADVEAFAQRALGAGYGYAFVASEVERLFGLKLARSQVRHWAIRTERVTPPKPPRLPSHIRRWQRGTVGELWQLDVTPDHWFGEGTPALPLFDMLDDCSRLQVGCAIYRNETVDAYMHFLHQAFITYGLPLEIYVDHARIFEGNKENSTTRLAWRLKFYEISFVFADSPEAKGKVERIHQIWQDRLPAYFRLNGLTMESNLEDVNRHVDVLREHRNRHEKHRELKMYPQVACDEAIAQGRTKLRPVPREPWWNYVWSTWNNIVIAQGGYVYYKNERLPTRAEPGTKAILCEHLDGTISIIKERPDKSRFPVVFFTNRTN